MVGDFVDTVSDEEENYRDIFIKGDIDNACRDFAKHLGMDKELEDLYRDDHERLENILNSK